MQKRAKRPIEVAGNSSSMRTNLKECGFAEALSSQVMKKVQISLKMADRLRATVGLEQPMLTATCTCYYYMLYIYMVRCTVRVSQILREVYVRFTWQRDCVL